MNNDVIPRYLDMTSSNTSREQIAAYLATRLWWWLLQRWQYHWWQWKIVWCV